MGVTATQPLRRRINRYERLLTRALTILDTMPKGQRCARLMRDIKVALEDYRAKEEDPAVTDPGPEIYPPARPATVSVTVTR